MRSLLLLFSLVLVSVTASPFWLGGWGGEKMVKWHKLKMPCGLFVTPGCPGEVNTPTTTTTTTTTTEAPKPGIFGLGIDIPGTGVVLKEGSLEETTKLKPIAVPCGVFPLPVCPGDASPSKGEGGLLGLGVKIPLTDIEILREGNAEDSWWPQGRKANVDLRWNKLEMPCGVFGTPACPPGVNQ